MASKMSAKDRRRRVEALIRRDGQQCRWCGTPLERGEVTIDHVIPKSLGGLNALTNLVLACRPCNEARGGFHTDGSFVGTGLPSRPRTWTFDG